MILGEVMINKEKVNMQKLREKSKNLEKNFKEYEFEYIGLGLQDIDSVLEKEC